ncbi:putative ABC transporter permease [Limosilactobacillus kribbianus]|uniref:putative ABC transporter permease n=1 Tax=Limosilactobacillus kribbianus TaxID=2982695 RepID=UPI0022653AA7|nr:putative ABC transporter permease [Limosilactobacillus kribbianus]
MPYSLSEIIVLFFTYAVIGWVWETIYCSIKDHHFAYRGFLFGPYCPVYGFAVTTILITTFRVSDNLILLFLVGFVVASIFEYVASLFLEKAFHMKLWDYSHLWGNLQGRVAPQISLFWAIGVVVLVRFIQPAVQRVINWEEAHTHGMLALMVVLVMGTDTILTIISVQHFHTTTKMWNERAEAYRERLRKRLESALPEEKPALAKRLDNWRAEMLDRRAELDLRLLNWNERRLVKSFPRLKVLDAKRFNEMKQDLLKHSK